LYHGLDPGSPGSLPGRVYVEDHCDPATTTTIGAPCPATGGPSPAAGSASGLEVVDLTPCDSRIEISMRNIGRLVSVIRRAEFRVRAMETIDTHCRGNSAALPISQTYDLRLPAYDGVGHVAGVTCGSS
jgi:hypothetical protein